MQPNAAAIVAMATDVQSKHAPVMVLMGNAATMARPRNVELAGSFIDVYIPKQVSAGEIQTYVRLFQ